MLGRHRRADVKDTHTLAAPTMKRVTLDAISEQSNQAALYAGKSVNRIRKITNQMQMLALNAKIEAAKAGQFGRGFSVVAAEVGLVGEEINTVAQDIQSILSQRLSGLNDMVAQMEKDTLGDRLVDLAFTAVDTIDRNLYERTCDVRWWATDSSFVTAAANHGPKRHCPCNPAVGRKFWTPITSILTCGSAILRAGSSQMRGPTNMTCPTFVSESSLGSRRP